MGNKCTPGKEWISKNGWALPKDGKTDAEVIIYPVEAIGWANRILTNEEIKALHDFLNKL